MALFVRWRSFCPSVCSNGRSIFRCVRGFPSSVVTFAAKFAASFSIALAFWEE
jgi:hypothetical protein